MKHCRRNVPLLHTSRYIIAQFYQTFPHVSSAGDKHWGKKAWVRQRWGEKVWVQDKAYHIGPAKSWKLSIKWNYYILLVSTASVPPVLGNGDSVAGANPTNLVGRLISSAYQVQINMVKLYTCI